MPITTFFPSGGGGGGGGSNDRFAPKYLVGNTLAPDSDTAVTAGTAAGFTYFADPGDGSGIAAALAAALAVPGDVWIRPGEYDLQIGAVVTPLAIPPGCTVRGSGTGSTRILGRSTGDQGVFVLTTVLNPDGRITGLRDLSISSPAAADGTGVSTAVVRCIDTTTIRDVIITFAPNDAGAITTALSYEITPNSNLPANDLDNVIIVSLSDGSGLQVGIHLLDTPEVGTPTVLARAVQVIGATSITYGIRLTGGKFVGQGLIILNWDGAAILHEAGSAENGAVHIDGCQAQTGIASPGTSGISLEGGGHVLRSILLQGNNFGNIGIRLSTQNGLSDGIQVEDCEVSGWANGIKCGDVPEGASVQSITVTDCEVDAALRGIWFSGPNVNDCHVLDNTVRVAFLGTGDTPKFAIGFEDDPQNPGAFSNFIKGNNASLETTQDPLAHTIFCGSMLTVVEGNNATILGGGYAIELPTGAERVTITGNITQANNDSLGCIHVAPGTPNVRNVVNGNNCTLNLTFVADPMTQAAIVYEGEQGTVNNNTIFTDPPAPGILLTADSARSTAIGNVADASTGTAVTDLGLANEVAHNIGA